MGMMGKNLGSTIHKNYNVLLGVAIGEFIPLFVFGMFIISSAFTYSQAATFAGILIFVMSFIATWRSDVKGPTRFFLGFMCLSFYKMLSARPDGEFDLMFFLSNLVC